MQLSRHRISYACGIYNVRTHRADGVEPRRIRIAQLAVFAGIAVFVVSPASAATRYYVDTSPPFGLFNTTASWSSSSGGATGASIPGPADIATFDANLSYDVFFFGASHTNLNLDVLAGDVTFHLDGASYIATSNPNPAVDVGSIAGQTAELTVIAGTLTGDTTGDDIVVGRSLGVGRLTVGAAGSIGSSANPSDLIVGGVDAGSGFVSVISSGTIFANVLDVGLNPNSSGQVSIIGPQATMSVDSTLSIGNQGVGAMSLTDGGRAIAVVDAYVGRQTGSIGSLAISGAGSQMAAVQLHIGHAGVGDLLVADGAELTTLGGVSMALQGGVATATVTGPGSEWRNTAVGPQYLGYGEVEFNVLDGARVEFNGGNTELGENGRARALVDGPGSFWYVDNLVVADAAESVLTIANGGAVVAGNAMLKIGDSIAGVGGIVNVTGPQSTLSSSGSIHVGDDGHGTLNVADGGEVTSYLGLSIKNGPTGSGAVNVDGGVIRVGPVALNGDLTINVGGALRVRGGAVYTSRHLVNNGTLLHSDGLLQVLGNFQAASSAQPLSINGADLDDAPTLELAGVATVTNVSTLTVGNNRRGELTVRDGRNWSVGANAINVGALAGGEGTINVSDGAIFGTGGAGSLNVGGAGAADGGTGTVNVNAGGIVDVGTLRLHPGGTINLDGGTLSLDSLGPITGTFNWNAGTIRFDAASQNIGAAEAAKFIGPDRTLRAGRSLTAFSDLGFSTQVAIDGGTVAAGTLSLSTNALLEIRSGAVEATGVIANSGSIILDHPLALLRGTTLNNGSLLRGTGVVRAALNNAAAAQVQVTAGQRLQLEAASHTNSGHISVIGGEIDVAGAVTNVANNGLISARDAILRFRSGVLNFGSLAFSNGTVDVYGDIQQAVSGRITVSAGGVANFYDDVELAPNAPNVQATAIGNTISKAVFFGSYNGGVVGGGQGFIEGDHRPGNSPGIVPFDGDAFYGPFSTLHIELGGLLPGSGFDQLQIGGDLSLNGALSVSLDGGHTLGVNQRYLIADVAGNLTGQFAGLAEGAVVGNFTGRDLFITYAAGDGNDVALFTAPSFTADFDSDGDVDSSDLSQWAGDFGVNALSDSDGDADSDGADFLAWQRQLGSVTQFSSAVNVPEPSTKVYGTSACLCLLRALMRRKSFADARRPKSFRAIGQACA